MSYLINGSTMRIMVVDDEPDLVKIVLAYLKAWNFDATGFTSPHEALDAFQKHPSAFSLVITDLRMPGMSGLELAKNLHQVRADIKIVLMTAFEVETVELDAKLPIIKYEEILKKPFRFKEVCNAVRKQLNVSG